MGIPATGRKIHLDVHAAADLLMARWPQRWDLGRLRGYQAPALLLADDRYAVIFTVRRSKKDGFR
jgi:hypothetical protein